MASPPEPILAARGIRKSFGGVEVLHGVDLVASGGSVLALLGENGAGKSTLVKIASGVYTADAGTISVGGADHESLTSREARDLGIAIISQEFQDASTLSVAENISLGNLPASPGVRPLGGGAAAGRGGAVSTRGGHRSRPDRRRSTPRGAPDHRDRPGAQPGREGAHPGRTHSGAQLPRGRGPVRFRAAPAERRGGHRVHHPPPRRGGAHLRPRAGSARRHDGPRCPHRRGRPPTDGGGHDRSAGQRVGSSHAGRRWSGRRACPAMDRRRFLGLLRRREPVGRPARGRGPLRKARIGRQRGG